MKIFFDLTRSNNIIEIDGLPTFIKSAYSFLDSGYSKSEDFIFCVLIDHIVDWNLGNIIYKHFPKSSIINIGSVTKGQAETVFISLGANFPSNQPIVIFNGDSYFVQSNLEYDLDNFQFLSQGYLTYFVDSSESNKWSFIKFSKSNCLTKIEEKKKVSNFASTGLYAFKDKNIFMQYYCKTFLENKKNKEYYISYMYKDMIKDGLCILAKKCDEFHCFGTPEDLDIYRNKNNKLKEGEKGTLLEGL